MLVQLPRLDRQQQQSAWYTALEAHGMVVRVDPVERQALPAWVAQKLAEQGQHLPETEAGRRALALFADRVEGHLLAAHQEIQKLALLQPRGELDPACIEASVGLWARYDVFKLPEAIWAGQVERALRMLDGLQAEDDNPVLVHWSLAEDIRTLSRLQKAVSQGKPLPLALREARVWGAREGLFERILPRLSARRLDAWLEAAHRCDGINKGIPHPDWPAQPWAAMRRLVLLLLEAA
jgi:DNA polymerase-3 subunit delta